MNEVRYADVDDRAMDRGGFNSAPPSAFPIDLRAEREEKALGHECDVLADWLDEEPRWDPNVRTCRQQVLEALAMPSGPKRLRSLRVAVETTRRCFPTAPRPGERDAIC